MKLISLALIYILLFSKVALSAEKWKITTLEWPPFTCQKCPEGGAGIKALKEALKSEGIEVEFTFYPWTRAIKEAASKEFVGYYPAWPEDVVDGFSPSEIVFKSPIGFVENIEKPLKNWNSLVDLQGMTVGVVQDYGNTKELMDLIKKGSIKADVSSDDISIVRKVGAQRIHAGVIDANVLRYFMQNDLKKESVKVRMHSKLLADKDLLIAFSKQNSAEKNEILKKALKKVNAQKIVDDYLAKNLK